ncbi:cobalt ECF transporter T component CbiQ [Niallia oryzisoli]|uniref:Cobalt ECF transporter T component CbiQ n=1 Tax=Niallia oryzisoli TaxID=1737571 RepID=A0ABZ2CDN2_9BACI
MLLIDKYAYFNGLKRIHPIEKMFFAFSLLFFSLAVKDVIVSLATFSVMSLFILFGAKIPVNYLIKLLLLPFFFLLSGIVTILFSIADIDADMPNVIWSSSFISWNLYITSDSLTSAFQLFCIAMGSISCLYFLILTTPVHDILKVLRKLKIPQLLIEIMEITYRFIFVFLETTSSIYQAQNSRLGYRTKRQWLYSISLLISALFIGVFKRAKELTNAMESRAYANEMGYMDDGYNLSAASWLVISAILACLTIVYILWGGR